MGKGEFQEMRSSNTKWTVTNSTFGTWNTKMFIPRVQIFSPWDILDEKVRQVSRNETVHTLEGQEQHFEDQSNPSYNFPVIPISCLNVRYNTCCNYIAVALTAHNWQKWKRVFLTCHCHKIYRDEAVGLKSCKNTWKITIFVKMWNLGQYRENLIFCQ